MRSTKKVALLVGAFGIAAASVTAAARQEPPVNAYGAAVKAFRDRCDAYLALHQKAAGNVPPLKETSDPGKLTSREQALGEAIRQLRTDAKPGDLFGSDLSPYIRKAVQKDWKKRSAADRKAITEEVPPGTVADVNATYPSILPLATFPANMLAALPPLAEGLEYRLVGRHLIIRDVKANIIVDVLPNVLPGART
jgi:hypothetical protein